MVVASEVIEGREEVFFGAHEAGILGFEGVAAFASDARKDGVEVAKEGIIDVAEGGHRYLLGRR